MDNVMARSNTLGITPHGVLESPPPSTGLGTIPQSRICAVPPMKRDDPPTSQQQNGMSFLHRQGSLASSSDPLFPVLGAGIYNFPLPQVPLGGNSQLLNQYPIHPDVKLKSLPFYEQIAEILKPTSLQQNIPQPPQHQNQQTPRCKEAEFAFHMTPHQVHVLLMSKDYKPGEAAVQLQLRFCALDSTVPQDDAFPPGLNVKVNNRILTLPNAIPTNKPGVEPKRPPKPLNITTLCHTNTNLPNKLHVTWNHEYGKAFVCAVYLVQRHNANALLEKLKKRGKLPAETTKTMIKKKLSSDADDDLCLTSIRVTLVCPLGQCRVQIPCRPAGCSHINCFDASFYLMMNEKKPTWICAVCDKNILFEDLYLDAYMEEVCRNAPPDCREVEFTEDGSWVPVMEEKEDSKKRKRQASDSDDSDAEREARKKDQKKEKEVMIDLTECTDEEDNVPPPPVISRAASATATASNGQRAPHASSSSTGSSSSSQLHSRQAYSTNLIGQQHQHHSQHQQQHTQHQLQQQQQHHQHQQQSSSTSSASQGSAGSSSASSRNLAQNLSTTSRAWPSTYSAAVAAASSAANNSGYYGSGFPAEYFNHSGVGANTSSSSVPQNIYNPHPTSYASYDIFQLLVEDRNQMQPRQNPSGSGGPRNVINLD
ncbi:E3 SUMO-protein ligase PIAS2 [Galendromus occidentalis]|uniref:E3 SUMO-protein ligase PIAS2 n=1 Tax=Galendromus occidentalis TaxID=34638 RepID=A0AAJ7WHC8_9ACAR|nr:E3 SUMO-protein ligase PIAS2 [Galendromus occidentalis]